MQAWTDWVMENPEWFFAGMMVVLGVGFRAAIKWVFRDIEKG